MCLLHVALSSRDSGVPAVIFTIKFYYVTLCFYLNPIRGAFNGTSLVKGGFITLSAGWPNNEELVFK